jgi:hypothetical protein
MEIFVVIPGRVAHVTFTSLFAASMAKARTVPSKFRRLYDVQHVPGIYLLSNKVRCCNLCFMSLLFHPAMKKM